MDKRLLAITAALFASATLCFGAGSPYITWLKGVGTNTYLTNAVIQTPLFRLNTNLGTHESVVVWNGTNTIPANGLSIFVTNGVAVAGSTNNAFANMLPGENIEFVGISPKQYVLGPIINANQAVIYELYIPYMTHPSQTISGVNATNWACRPRAVRWTDDNSIGENYGGFFDCNGSLWLHSIGDQGAVNFINVGTGEIATLGMVAGSQLNNVANPFAGMAFSLSGALTNAAYVAQFAPVNAYAFSLRAPSETIDVDDNGIMSLQFGLAGWHQNPIPVRNVLQLTNGTSSQLSNKLALVVIGSSISATNGGFNWTNTTGRNITVFVDNAGVTASAFKINGTTIYTSALGDFSAPLQDQEWISMLYTVGTPTMKYKPF